MKLFLKITILSLLPAAALCIGGLFGRVSAAPGNVTVNAYVVMDGLLSPNTKLPGLVVWVASPIHHDLFKKATYDKRGGSPEMFMVMPASGTTSLAQQNGNTSCGQVATDFQVCQMFVYGPSFQAIPFGGMPRSEQTKYGAATQDNIACQQTFNWLRPELGEAGKFYETGYLGMAQCVSAVYQQCPGVNPTSNEYYRFVPYFPKGWKSVYGANFPFSFNANDPKGGGTFVTSFSAPTQDNNFMTRFVKDTATQNFTTINFPNATTPYLGTTANPYFIQSGKVELKSSVTTVPAAGLTSESVYLDTVGNNTSKTLNFYYVPAEAIVDSPTPTPTPTASPTPTPTPTPTHTPTPTPSSIVACGGSCNPGLGTTNNPTCPQNPPHTCVANSGSTTVGTCKLTACVQSPAICYANGCTIIPTCGQSCDPAQGANSCTQDHVCRDKDGDGKFSCILNICDSNPSSCTPGFCSAAGAVTVDKTGTKSCGSTPPSGIVNYTITLTNPDTTAKVEKVEDDLDAQVLDSYVDTASITNGGILASGKITWSAVTVPASGTLQLKYKVVFPATFSNPVTNSVTVTEGTSQVASDTFTITPFCAPSTALISDATDRVLVAAVLIMIGMLMYRLQLHQEIGNLFWNNGGKKIYSVLKINLHPREKNKKSYERKVEREFDDHK